MKTLLLLQVPPVFTPEASPSSPCSHVRVHTEGLRTTSARPVTGSPVTGSGRAGAGVSAGPAAPARFHRGWDQGCPRELFTGGTRPRAPEDARRVDGGRIRPGSRSLPPRGVSGHVYTWDSVAREARDLALPAPGLLSRTGRWYSVPLLMQFSLRTPFLAAPPAVCPSSSLFAMNPSITSLWKPPRPGLLAGLGVPFCHPEHAGPSECPALGQTVLFTAREPLEGGRTRWASAGSCPVGTRESKTSRARLACSEQSRHQVTPCFPATVRESGSLRPRLRT